MPMIEFLKKNKISFLIIFLIFIFGIIFINKYPHSIFHPTSDTYEYADIARNLLKYKKFVVHNVYSLQLAFDFSRKTPPPSILRMPMYPIAISFFFKIFGISDKSILLCSFTFYILSGILLIIFLGKFNIDEKIKILTLLFFILNPIFVNLTFRGLSESFAVFLFLLFLIFLFHARTFSDFFISGLFLGLFTLTRYYISLLFLIPVSYCFYKKETPKREIFLFLIGVFLPLLPWFFRMYKITGNPFFSLAFYSLDGYERVNIPYITSCSNIFRNFLGFIDKKLDSLMFYLKTLGNITPFYFMPFAIIYIFSKKDESLKNLSDFFFISLVIFSILYGVINPEHRFLFYLSFFVILFSLMFLKDYGKFFNFFVIFTLFLVIHEDRKILREAVKRNKNYFKSEKVFEEIKELTKEDEFIITNSDALLGFYTERSCIFPLTYKRDYEYLFKIVPVQGFFIYRGRFKLFYMKYNFKDIKKIIEKEFAFKKKFRDGSLIYLRK